MSNFMCEQVLFVVITQTFSEHLFTGICIPGFKADYSVVLKPQVAVNYWLFGLFCDITVTLPLQGQNVAVQTVPSSDVCWNCLIL